MWNLYSIRKFEALLKKKQFRGKRVVKKILKKLIPDFADDLTVKTKHGYIFKINPLTDKGIERKIYEFGVYEEGTLWCFNHIINRNDVVFDVGANIGLTAIHASRLTGRNGKVFAFEPLVSTYDLLLENLKHNNVKNVIPINSALSDDDGVGFIFENLHINRGAASLIKNSKTAGKEVKKEKLDNFIKNFDIENIDFLKVDIEGSEIPMLKGSMQYFTTPKKPIICIEFSREVKSDYNADMLYYILKEKFRYDIYKQKNGKDSLTPLIKVKGLEDLPNHDNLYCFQEYHYKKVSKKLFYKKELRA